MSYKTIPSHFVTQLQEFARKHIAPIADEIDQNNRFPRELWPTLGEHHLLGITIDTAYGGTQLGFFAQVLAIEEISRVSASVGLSFGVHTSLCANQIQRFGTPSQKKKFLPKLCLGEWIGALAMSEKNAGSDVLSMQLRAEEKSDHFILNGHKMWITNGPDADILVVYAKTNPELQAHGISCFVIEKNFSGFHANAKLNKIGMRGSSTSELIFKNCIVPKENMLGKMNDGLAILMNGLDYERAVLSAGPLGIMQACLDLVIPYVKQRKQFEKPLSAFQLIQTKIADLYSRLEASRAYVYDVAKQCDLGHVAPETAAGAYLFVSENATQMALQAMQCLGGNGYLNDFPAGRLLRDAKLYEIGAGTTEIRRLVIARALLKDKKNDCLQK